MKTNNKILLFFLFSLSTTVVFAQNNNGKKEIFGDFPNTISLSKTTLLNTFSAIPGQFASISFADGFVFSGTVISNEIKYSNLQSVIIKSPQFGNALFQLSKIINQDNSISFSGRIMNPDALDGYEIKKDGSDNYRFQKFETKKVLQDCSF